MATLSTEWPTLIDVANAMDPDGKYAKIVDVLSETNRFLDDVPWQEGNKQLGHVVTRAATEPSPVLRDLNEGETYGKGTDTQVEFPIAHFSLRSKIAEDVWRFNGGSPEFRFSRDMKIAKKFPKVLCEEMFYGALEDNTKGLDGLTELYGSTSDADYGNNVILGGGSGSDNTSIWIMNWNPDSLYGVYGKAGVAGLEMEDLGRMDVDDSSSNPVMSYVTRFNWRAGIVVEDPRYCVRIANIDVSDLAADKSGSSADLTDLIAQGLETIEATDIGRVAIYCNRTVRSMLRRQALQTTNVNFGIADVFGHEVTTIDGYPLRLTEQITDTEATIS